MVDSARDTLPLFPLQTVLLPGAHLPLHVFEPRYRQLTRDLITGVLPDREFGVIAMRTSAVREVERLDQLYAVGCTAVLREAKQLPDGRFDLFTTGARRFRLLELRTAEAPYLVGTVEWVPDDPISEGAEIAAARLSDIARTAHRRYCRTAWHRDDWDAPPASTGVAELGYLLAADCLLPLPDQQRLLEEAGPLRRLRMVCRLLTREAGFLSTLRAVPPPLTDLTEPPAASELN